MDEQEEENEQEDEHWEKTQKEALDEVEKMALLEGQPFEYYQWQRIKDGFTDGIKEELMLSKEGSFDKAFRNFENSASALQMDGKWLHDDGDYEGVASEDY